MSSPTHSCDCTIIQSHCTGPTGDTGSIGVACFKGPTGTMGFIGHTDETGPTGFTGVACLPGQAGNTEQTEAPVDIANTAMPQYPITNIIPQYTITNIIITTLAYSI